MWWIARNKQTGGTVFHYRRVEPIFIWGKPKKRYNFDFIESLTDRNDGLLEKHSCPKPVKLIEDIVYPVTEYQNIVLDIFGGSGSTMIACEKVNRRCLMIELDPYYCQVILDRWEQYTGNKSEKVEMVGV